MCLFKEIEGKVETEAKCFICEQHIPLNTILNSVNVDTTLADVILLKENDAIPRIVEDAALHVIKQKLVNSESNSFGFPPGGPRVGAF